MGIIIATRLLPAFGSCYCSTVNTDLVDVDGFGEDGSESLAPAARPVGVLVVSSLGLRDVHVPGTAAAVTAATPQEQHGSAGRAARAPRAAVVRRVGRVVVSRLGHGADDAAEAAEDVLVEEAESGGHDEAEVGQRVERQRNADDRVQHGRQSTAGRARRYVTVTYNHRPARRQLDS